MSHKTLNKMAKDNYTSEMVTSLIDKMASFIAILPTVCIQGDDDETDDCVVEHIRRIAAVLVR
jgi:hypothetical protein